MPATRTKPQPALTYAVVHLKTGGWEHVEGEPMTYEQHRQAAEKRDDVCAVEFPCGAMYFPK